MQRILDAMTAPAIVRNSRVDYLSANQLGRALYAPMFDSREQPANSARFTFLDPAATSSSSTGNGSAKDLVAHLRSEAGRNPYDRDLSDLVGELSTRSDDFRTSGGPRTTCASTRRHQASPPPGRRRARAQLRGDGARRPMPG